MGNKMYNIPQYRIVGILAGVNLAVWQFSGNPPKFCSIYGITSINSTIIAPLKYLRREGPVHECSTLLKKETEQVNEHVR